MNNIDYSVIELDGIRMTSELKLSDIVSVERTKEYSEIESEVRTLQYNYTIVSSHLLQAADVNPNNRPPRNWPIEGKVQFDRYSTRYREGLNLVLRNITAEVSGGQKVSVCVCK